MNWLILFGVCMMIISGEQMERKKEVQKICKNLKDISEKQGTKFESDLCNKDMN